MFGLMVLNGTIVLALGRLFSLKTVAAIESALLLAASGEFAFVVLHSAVAVVVTMHSPEATAAVVAAARADRSDLTIVARAHDAHQAKRLYELGATDAVPETDEASLQLSEALLVEIGIPMNAVIASIYQRREAFRMDLKTRALAGRREPPS
jgi:voltage-gated potassium channel Kch